MTFTPQTARKWADDLLSLSLDYLDAADVAPSLPVQRRLARQAGILARAARRWYRVALGAEAVSR